MAELHGDDSATPETEYTFAYDDLNRLTSLVDTADRASFHGAATGSAAVPTSVPVQLDYVYDDFGELAQTSATLFAGLANEADDYVNDYSRDTFGRVTQIVQSGTAAAGQPVIARKVVDLAYNRVGLLDSVTRSVGAAGSESTVAISDYSYFETGYLQSINHEDSSGTLIGGYSWDYDVAGQVSSFSAPEGVTSYTYDNTGQLIRGVLSSPSSALEEDFEYDSTGNRISQTTDGVTTQTLVNRNRLLSDGTYDYTYDGNGNRTRKREIATGEYQDFTWDHRNRLTHVEFFSTSGTLLKTVRYSYDAFDQRILTEVRNAAINRT